MKHAVKSAILSFMRLTLIQMHPLFTEGDFERMKKAEYAKGDEFEGTEFEYRKSLIQAYYMKTAIDDIEREM